MLVYVGLGFRVCKEFGGPRIPAGFLVRVQALHRQEGPLHEDPGILMQRFSEPDL